MKVDDGYADRVIHEALVAVAGGLDPERVATVVADVFEALAKQAKALKGATYPPKEYEKIARAMAHAAKCMDGAFRLQEFAAGRPDTRPDGARDSRDVLRLLTNEQLAQVHAWVTEAEARRLREPDAKGAAGKGN